MPSNNPYEAPESQDERVRPDSASAGSFGHFSIPDDPGERGVANGEFRGTLDSRTEDIFEPQHTISRRIQVYLYTFGTYVLHTLALWGIVCFHDAHGGSTLKPVFESIATTYGRVGLLGVALVYAIAPATVYLIAGTVAANKITSDQRWRLAMDVIAFSLGPTLFLDIIFGLNLFTTG